MIAVRRDAVEVTRSEVNPSDIHGLHSYKTLSKMAFNANPKGRPVDRVYILHVEEEASYLYSECPARYYISTEIPEEKNQYENRSCR